MTDTIVERDHASSRSQKLKVIDCDIHPITMDGLRATFEYMPLPWRKRFERKHILTGGASPLTTKFSHPNGATIREDARPPSGAVAGSDIPFIVSDHIVPHNIEAALLNCLQPSIFGAGMAGPDESIVIAKAFNDLFIDQWLPVDPRLRLAMTVTAQDPAEAAAEIRRVGQHKQVAGILLPPIEILLGNRYWWPVYEAAQAMNLPIVLHVTGMDGIYHGAPTSAGGNPESYIERYVTLFQAAEANVNSLVFTGTFDRFKNLKFLFAEYGCLWVLPLLWRMDKTWRELRREVPWVRKSPIDYVHEHCRFTTQPIDEPPEASDLDAMIKLLGTEMLCFSSDYPHWDNDMPEHTFRSMPPDQRQKVMYDNAAGVLRL